MLKLMKYEWRKQWFSKLIMIGVLAVLVLAFIIFSQLQKGDSAAFVLALMFFAIFLFSIFAGVEAINTFHKDLKSRQSYLLFMIPQPSWKVLAAKVIIALLTMLFTSVLCALAAALCFLHEIARNGMWHELYNTLNFILKMLRQDLPQLTDLIPPFTALFFRWFFIIMLAFFSDIIIMTIFSGFRKGAGLLGAVLFVIVAYASAKILDLILPGDGTLLLTGVHAWISCGYYAVLCVLLFAGICHLMEKKLSV